MTRFVWKIEVLDIIMDVKHNFFRDGVSWKGQKYNST